MNQKSILFLSTSASWPLTDGKRQRTWFLIEALSKEYLIDFVFIGNEKERALIEKNSKNIRNLFYIRKSINIPIFPSLFLKKNKKKIKESITNQIEKIITKNDCDKYEFVFGRYLYPFYFFPRNNNMKLICDIDDVFFETMKTKIKNSHNLLKKLKTSFHYLLSGSTVNKLLKRIDLSLVVKESDCVYRGLKNAILQPNLPFGFYIDQKKKTNNQQSKVFNNTFGFIGKLSYQPNIKGLYKFIISIWNPLMLKGFNGKFIISGSGIIPADLLDIINQSKNIEFIGFVENVQEFWNQIDVLIVPIEEGGGSNIKIAEAFINGKKVIASTFSSRGYERFIKSGNLLIAENNNNWINHISSNISAISENDLNKIKKIFNLDDWNENLINQLLIKTKK